MMKRFSLIVLYIIVFSVVAHLDYSSFKLGLGVGYSNINGGSSLQNRSEVLITLEPAYSLIDLLAFCMIKLH